MNMTELHVAPHGDDAAGGTQELPFRTIAAAAAVAHAGDIIVIGKGIYRERVDPPRGGASATAPITYTAAPGERVVLTGSDVFRSWTALGEDLWRLVIPNAYFGEFNPYAEVVHGDWFSGRGRRHRRGNVFLDDVWLPEVESEQALAAGCGLGWTSTVDGNPSGSVADSPVEGHDAFAPAKFDPTGNTTIVARLPDDVDPNAGRVEVSVRSTVFTPTSEHIDYITVRGFEIRNAATNWASPTAGQEGIVTPYWCRGWVIADNEICYSRCCGIALAKNRDEHDGERGTTEGFYLTIRDAQVRDAWSRDTIGSHTVRNNRIHHCGQTGIVGALGCAFSTIEDNEIHDCNTQGIWGGAEMAGIKLHGAIDVMLRGNHIYRCGQVAGVWLDWMAQGAHIRENLLHDNVRDIFVEVNHGPIIMANNILLSREGLLSNSRGVVIAHNLITGGVEVCHDDRETPYLKPHSTELGEMRRVCAVGDTHWINNVLGPDVDLRGYDDSAAELPSTIAGNVRLGPSGGSQGNQASMSVLERLCGKWTLSIGADPESACAGDVVAGNALGVAVVPGQPYTEPDGSPVVIDHDYYTAPRTENATPGPFARPVVGTVTLWPRQQSGVAASL
jgi:alpha-N-arabinofuranosidase